MTTQVIATLIPYLIVGLLVLAVLLFLVSLQQLRRGRRGHYWRLRRQAGLRGGRLFLLSVALFVLALSIGFFSGFTALALSRVNGLLTNRSEIAAVPSATPTVEF